MPQQAMELCTVVQLIKRLRAGQKMLTHNTTR